MALAPSSCESCRHHLLMGTRLPRPTIYILDIYIISFPPRVRPAGRMERNLSAAKVQKKYGRVQFWPSGNLHLGRDSHAVFSYILKQKSRNYSKASGNGASFLSLVKVTNDFLGLPLTSLVSKSSSLSSTTILYVFASGAPKERMCSYWNTSSGLPSPRL